MCKLILKKVFLLQSIDNSICNSGIINRSVFDKMLSILLPVRHGNAQTAHSDSQKYTI